VNLKHAGGCLAKVRSSASEMVGQTPHGIPRHMDRGSQERDVLQSGRKFRCEGSNQYLARVMHGDEWVRDFASGDQSRRFGLFNPSVGSRRSELS